MTAKNTMEYKLGQLIHARRVDKLIRIDDLSSATGVSSNTLSNLERGRIKKPTIDTYECLCAELDISIEDICATLKQPYEKTAVSKEIDVLDSESVLLLQQGLQKGDTAVFERVADLYKSTTGKSNFDKELITYFWENKKAIQLDFLPYRIEKETIFLTYLKGGALHYCADVCTYFNHLLSSQERSSQEIAKQLKIPETAVIALTDPTPSLERRFFITHIAKLNAELGQGEFLPMVFNAQRLRRRIQLDPFISSTIIAYRQLQQKEPSLARSWLQSLLPTISRL